MRIRAVPGKFAGRLDVSVPEAPEGSSMRCRTLVPGEIADFPDKYGTSPKIAYAVSGGYVEVLAYDSKPVGAAGAGSPGRQGSQGATGVQGNTGIRGATGLRGPTGPHGTAGSCGIQGSTGTQGRAGTDGTIGATGIQGNTGIQGITGPQGPGGTGGGTGGTVDEEGYSFAWFWA